MNMRLAHDPFVMRGAVERSRISDMKSSALLLLTAVLLLSACGPPSELTMRSALIHSASSISSEPIDGWTYGIPLDVAWTAEDGSFHQNGRPACLPADSGPTGMVGPITFASVNVVAGGQTWRPVVWVSCRR